MQKIKIKNNPETRFDSKLMNGIKNYWNKIGKTLQDIGLRKDFSVKNLKVQAIIAKMNIIQLQSN